MNGGMSTDAGSIYEQVQGGKENGEGESKGEAEEEAGRMGEGEAVARRRMRGKERKGYGSCGGGGSSSSSMSISYGSHHQNRRSSWSLNHVAGRMSSSSSSGCSKRMEGEEAEEEDEEEGAMANSGATTQQQQQRIQMIMMALESPTPSTHSTSHVWDDPSCDAANAAPASAWSTLGNRALLCRPLPLDVGRCSCYISRERQGGIGCYALYTDEGHGRQDRKLAIAFHKRPAGKSEFVVFSHGVELNGLSILGKVQANLVGSRYLIWDEAEPSTSQRSNLPPLLGVIMFQPTVTTLAGSFRVIRVSIPKYQSTQIGASSTHRENGLAPDWEENTQNCYRLYSRKPHYNKVTKCYELDFRDRSRKSSKIVTSASNLQLTMTENGKQTILMLGKIGKTKFLMEYRFPLTAYQAFSISLASMDSKLCCSL